MSIKPVDFQVMLPKTGEVSKIHSDEHQKSDALQQQQASLNQNKTETNLRQVHSQEKTQDAKIREKQERERQERRKKKNGGNKDSGSKDQRKTIDIRL